MSEYLAPNGKPSKLTPEQYRLVRTKAFKDWFGDWENDPANASKVVDDNGEPMVVYHYTNAKNIREFYPFAQDLLNGNKSKKEVEDIISKWKNSKSISLMDFRAGTFFTPKRGAYSSYGEIEYACFLKGDFILNTGDFNKREKYIGTPSMKSPIWYYWNDLVAEIVALYPEQIKLADGSNTTFDGENPDIRFETGGEIPLSVNKIENQQVSVFLSRNTKYNGQFVAKNGKLFYITFDLRQNTCKVYNAELFVEAFKNGYFTGNEEVAVAVFSIDYEHKTFSGYSENQSIQVKEEYRRIGIATAITDFVEDVLKMKYKPSKLLSKEMQGFVENRFKFLKGGRTLAQTPAPKKERIYGSEKNKPESSKDTKSAKKIKFSEKTLETIKNKVAEHNEKHPSKKVNLASAKAVVRRGMGAYSSTHRPTISGGKPNSRVAWGLARLNAFFYKIINGKSKSGKYSQDNDLIEELGYKVQKYADGGDIQEYKESMGISEFYEGGESSGDVNYKNQPRDLSQIENYENIYKGAEFYSFSDSSEKQEKSDRWFELFRINQKERQLTTSEFIEFMQLSNELSWEEFADGGEAKPKKVYVSIKLNFEIEGKFGEYFYRYEEKPFQELKNGVLEGVVGVSTSPNNIAEWFINRDCLIVMDYDEFINLNDTETINYNDPNQLMKNNLFLFKRLYANITRFGEQEGVYIQTLTKLNQKIIPEIILEMNLVEGQKYSELQRISRFLSPYETSAFTRWIESNKISIESPEDLTNAILDFNKLNDNYLGDGFKNPVLTFDELFIIVEKGIKNAGNIYESEQEVVLLNKKLVIPKNSQLFFIGKNEVGKLIESNKLELIEKYQLKNTYKVYFVDRVELEKYRSIWIKKEEEKYKNKLEEGKKQLEIKKEKVTNELLSIFLNKSLNSLKEQYEKEYIEFSESKMFYDVNSDNFEEVYWYSIPLVKKIVNFYIECVKTNWNRFIEQKKVQNLNLYSFSNFCGEVKYEINDFFEKNKDELDKLNDWKEINGNGWLNSYGLKKLLKTSVDDYENLPEWITYKKLAKMYLEKMGREIYRYYDIKDVPLLSNYEDGGQIEIPSEFWGNEAGGVLIYCRKTKRYLLLERSKYVNEPNTWNLISGKIEEYESVKEAVIRECFEEIGFHISDLIPIYEYETNDFIFHNFLSVVDDEFHVDFNWESSDYGWFNLKDFPKKLHFGLKILLESVNLIDIVNSNKEYYQRRNIGGGLEYYKRKGIEHWVFTTKEDFEKNAQEDNTIEF